MSMIKGYIPSKICYFYTEPKPINIGYAWDYDAYNIPIDKSINVLSATIADEADTYMMQQSKKEAMYFAGNQTKFPLNNILQDVQENNPIKTIQLLTKKWDQYKVLANNYCVDLHSDVLTDTLINCKTTKGGIIHGDFIWAIQDGKPKLIRKGSVLHTLLKEYSDRKKIKNVKKRDLEIGGVYQSLKKDMAVFLGYVDTVYYEYTNDDWQQRYNRFNKTAEQIDFNFKNKNNEAKVMLFYVCSAYQKKSIEDIKREINNFTTDGMELKFRHNYIEKLDTISLPDNYIEIIRQAYITKIKQTVLEYTGAVEPSSYYKVSGHDLKYRIANYSGFINMKPYKSAPTTLFDVNKLLNYS